MRPIRIVFFAILIGFVITSSAQDFEFAKPTPEDMAMKTYPLDTSAVAVVLREFGRASISNTVERDLIFVYHVKIKILKLEGIKQGDFLIRLHTADVWKSLEAATYNSDGSFIRISLMSSSAVTHEKLNANYKIVRFNLPNVRVGSVIEVKYEMASPYKYNFKRWIFQDDIPKVKSEYWTTIPGNFIYNITLKGYLELTKNESNIEEKCFDVGSGLKAGCVVSKYVMENIPAFIEEEYMTSRNNFISQILYELSEYRGFDGINNKIAQEWKDVDKELRDDPAFGIQLRKARNLDDEKLKELVGTEADPLRKANLIYDYIKNRYEWDGSMGILSHSEVKKAYETRKGNVGDINLTLIGFLQKFDLDAAPVILSTRDNGSPIEVHPIVSVFNYVVACVKIGEKSYLLDATDRFLPFGMLPDRCLNGKGRLVSKEDSDWIDLKPSEKRKRIQSINLKLAQDGTLSGDINIQSLGYDAMFARAAIGSENNKEEYLKVMEAKLTDARLTNFVLENFDDLSKPLIEKMDIAFVDVGNADASTIYFSPFILGRFENNPFKTAQRLFPVDYGVARDHTLILSLEIPDNMKVEELPANTSFALPQGGGKYLLNVSTVGNKIMLTNVFTLNKAVYSPEEYHFLREYYARIVQVHQSLFVLKRK